MFTRSFLMSFRNKVQLKLSPEVHHNIKQLGLLSYRGNRGGRDRPKMIHENNLLISNLLCGKQLVINKLYNNKIEVITGRRVTQRDRNFLTNIPSKTERNKVHIQLQAKPCRSYLPK